MRRSKKQRKAAQQNGAQSFGPTTPEGKSKAAQNAIKHGLTSKSVCLSHECRDAFNEMQQSLADHFQPATDAEWLIIEEITALSWKIRRCWAIQTQQFEIQLAKDAQDPTSIFKTADGATKTTVAEEHHVSNKAVENIRRYEERLIRLKDRSITQLLRLQNNRPTQEPLTQIPQKQELAPEQQNKQNEPKPPAEVIEITRQTATETEETIEKETEPCTGPSETPQQTM